MENPRRKVIEVGGQLMISLPSDWCRENDVAKGDVAMMDDKEEFGCLVIRLLREE